MNPAPTSKFARYASIYAELWKNSVAREMGFKANFILWIIVEMLWFALQLAFFNVIYSHTESIAGWTRWEVVLLVGSSHFIQQIFQAFFLTNCVNLSELVRTGKMDFMLLLPVNTRFLVSLRTVDLGGFVNAASAVAVMAFAIHKLQIMPSVTHVISFLLLALCGILLHYSLMMILAASAFYTVRAQGIVWGYYQMFNLARMPDTAFRGLFRVVFTYVLPVTLVSNVPVRTLINTLSSPARAGVLVAITVGWFIISEAIWRFSLRRYTSASS
ncbi:MAG TPA: ABC-2 family transporter protein [Verrucomicrobiae bacterium]|nr:ABC-2 family transporter protein [Verrucomicrobiae bacterium]